MAMHDLAAAGHKRLDANAMLVQQQAEPNSVASSFDHEGTSEARADDSMDAQDRHALAAPSTTATQLVKCWGTWFQTGRPVMSCCQ